MNRLISRLIAETWRLTICLIIALTVATEPVHAGEAIVATANAAGQVRLAWDASTSEPNVARYLVGVRTSVSSESLVDAGKATTFTVDNLTAGQTYLFRVYAENSSGRSGPSNEVSETLPADVPDTTAPTAPSSLTGTPASSSQVNLSWTAATDNVAVAGYRIRRNSLPIADVPGSQTTYSDVGLTLGTQYSYTVQAMDAAGNLSPDSPIAIVSTLGDTTAPSAPSGLTGVPTTTSIALTWTASSDNLGVVSYRVSRNGQPLSTTSAVTFTDTGLTPNLAYSYAVVALDAAGNVSPPVTLTVSTLPLPSTTCDNFSSSSPVAVLITDYDRTFVRGQPKGMRIEWNIGSLAPITRIDVDLLDDGEPTQVYLFGSGVGFDGRFIYGTFFKPVRDGGPFPISIRAFDANGGVGEAICRPGVIVSSPR